MSRKKVLKLKLDKAKDENHPPPSPLPL